MSETEMNEPDLVRGDQEGGRFAVICADEFGVTIEGIDPDPEVLIEKFSAAARQEFTDWPTLDPIPYMLIAPEEVPLARAQEEEEGLSVLPAKEKKP
jgi:hypothetical protein